MSLTATLGTDLPGGNVEACQKTYRATGTIAATGNYASGGVALSFAGVVPVPKTTPILVAIKGILGHVYQYVKSSGKVKVFTTGVGAGLQTYAEADIKGSANTNVGIAGGALPTNGALVSSLATADGTPLTIAANPDIPRNVSISFKNTNAGANTGTAVDVVIVGKFRGAAQTETISFTQLELTSTAQNEVATKYGSKPFDTITSITPSVTQPANWQRAAGIGSKIGLPRDLYTPAEADVIKLTKNAADLSPSGIVDTTNMTVNFGVLANADDISVEYNAAPAALQEIKAAAFPATVTGDTITFEAYFPKA